MAELKYNLSELYSQVFGLKALPYPLLVAENGFGKNPFSASRAREVVNAILGNKQSGYSGQVMNALKINGILLPNEPMIDLGLTKNIVVTEMVNNAGTVKESMGLNDWSITIRGIIIGEDEDVFPEREIKELRSIVENEGAVSVESEYLQLFDIFYLAVQSFTLPPMEGAMHIQPYEIKVISDKIIELIIREDER